MIEVKPQTRNALWGLIGAVLAAGWVVYGIVGQGSNVFLAVMVALTILLGAVATFLLRVPRSPNR